MQMTTGRQLSEVVIDDGRKVSWCPGKYVEDGTILEMELRRWCVQKHKVHQIVSGKCNCAVLVFDGMEQALLRDRHAVGQAVVQLTTSRHA